MILLFFSPHLVSLYKSFSKINVKCMKISSNKKCRAYLYMKITYVWMSNTIWKEWKNMISKNKFDRKWKHSVIFHSLFATNGHFFHFPFLSLPFYNHLGGATWVPEVQSLARDQTSIYAHAHDSAIRSLAWRDVILGRPRERMVLIGQSRVPCCAWFRPSTRDRK